MAAMSQRWIETVVRSGDVSLRVREEGHGEPVLLLHGFADTLDSWWDVGWPDALGGHRVIAFDARGHGGSSRPHDPAGYTTAARLGDAVAVLDAARAARAHVLGYSMGGWTALALALAHPARVSSLLIGGAQPFGQSLDPLRRVLANGLPAVARLFQGGRGELPAAFRARLLANDVRALAATIAEDRPDLGEAAVRGLAMPVLLWAGERDPLRPLVERMARLAPAARAVVVPGASHFAAFDHPMALAAAAEHLGRVGHRGASATPAG
jgi:pimeloyl-ACP methyl ester carboxylesterase